MRSRYRTLLWPLLAALLPLLAVWLAPPRVRAAGTWYVSANTGDDANDCAAPATPCLTIQAALGKPGFLPGDTVLVADGLYLGNNKTPVPISKDVILSGGWDDNFSTQDDSSSIKYGVMVYSGVTVTMNNFSLFGYGYAGPGLHNEGTLTLGQVYVTVSDENGVYNSGSIVMVDSEVERADYTGIINTGTMVISNTLIHDNLGIGISNSGTLTMYNSMVWGHIVTFICHGISNRGEMVLVNSAVMWNGETFGPGGGVCNYGRMTLINSSIRDNRVFATTGGGIHNSGDLFLHNTSVVFNNVWSGTGGGIYGGNITIQNSLVAENVGGIGPDCSPGVQSSGYSLIGDTSDCNITNGLGDLLDVASGVFPQSWATAPLIYTSPAIDAGDPAGCKDMNGNPLSTDQRGVSRVGRCDIGSYEYDPQLDPLLYFRMPWVENR